MPAFPGAEGFGATAVVGGPIIRVTSLGDGNDSSPTALVPGQLRWALNQAGPKQIYFDVSGTIALRAPIRVPRAKASGTSIIGHTSPGAITICGSLWVAEYDSNLSTRIPVTDIVVRNLKFRGLHTISPTFGSDATNGDLLVIYGVDRFIVDHCSFTGSVDESFDVGGYSDNGTIQWCTVEESAKYGQGGAQHNEGDHNYGALIAYCPNGSFSFHHNLIANHIKRFPEFGTCKAVEMVGNVLYNCAQYWGSAPITEKFNCSLNTWKSGPSKDPRQGFTIWYALPAVPTYFENNAYYVPPTVFEPSTGINVVQPPSPGEDRAAILALGFTRSNRTLVTTPTPYPMSSVPITPELSVAEAYSAVLEKAGAFPRDTTTIRTVQEVSTFTGGLGLRGPYEYPGEFFLPEATSEAANFVKMSNLLIKENIVPRVTINVTQPTVSQGAIACDHSGLVPGWDVNNQTRSGPFEVLWPPTAKFTVGSLAVFKAVPQAGYYLQSWQVSGVPEGEQNVYGNYLSLTVPNGDVTVSAAFTTTPPIVSPPPPIPSPPPIVSPPPIPSPPPIVSPPPIPSPPPIVSPPPIPSPPPTVPTEDPRIKVTFEITLPPKAGDTWTVRFDSVPPSTE